MAESTTTVDRAIGAQVDGTSQGIDAVQQDRQLVDACLAGQPRAWDELYQRYSNGLLFSIRLMLGPYDWDPNLFDEIAARVWYALVANNFQLLNRFDVNRGCRLSTFLARIAKSEASAFFRGERRRRRRERVASRPEADKFQYTQQQFLAQMREFQQTLTCREKEFVTGFLLAHENGEQFFTEANRWQLSHRVREKLRDYLDDFA
jgi:hypothetical protein